VSSSELIREVEIQKGELLFSEGDTSSHFYILHSGEVQVFREIPGRGRVALARVGAGHAVGEFALIDSRARSASAIALSTVTASLISEEGYQQLLADLPEWATVVMTSMVTRIRTMNDAARH
jgi:CRP/FNR family cyclic AMP-dependent transcriptional regulator